MRHRELGFNLQWVGIKPLAAAPGAPRALERYSGLRSGTRVVWFCRSKAIGENLRMVPFQGQLMCATLRKVVKRLHYPLDIMLVCVRWYAAYPLSVRNLEMMAERGVMVDHAMVRRWVQKVLQVLAAVFRRGKRPVGSSWRVDETSIRVSGQWKYL